LSRKIAQTLVKITMLLDDHSPAEQSQAMAFLLARYPSCAESSDRAWERIRKAEWRERQMLQPELEGTLSQGHVPRDSEAPPAPVVKASKAFKALDLSEAVLEEASKKLDKADFDFLAACPEPFRTQWLKDPEWWVSLKDGYPRLNHQQEASKCMGWVQSKGLSPAQLERLNLRARLRSWFAKADAWRQQAEERKAVRR
jgi:hypothetical protein